MDAWTPDEETARQLAVVLGQSTSESQVVRQQAKQALEDAKQQPDLNNYLVYLLVTPSLQIPSNIRATAGLWLKNNILSDWSHIHQQVFLHYVKEKIPDALADPDNLVRNIASIVLTTLYSKLRGSHWPNLMDKLLKMIESSDPPAQEGAMSALAKICEDSADDLDRDDGTGHRPSAVLIPRLIEYCSSGVPRIRSNAVFCLSQFIPQQSQDFLAHIDVFLQALFTVANDPYPGTRRNIASAFNLLLEVRPDKLIPHLEGVTNYSLHCIKDDDEHVALEGAEFILSLAESTIVEPEYIQPLLPTIIPTILSTMVYSDMDIFVLENLNENDENVEDRAEDMRPVNIKSKDGRSAAQKQGSAQDAVKDKSSGDVEDDDESDDDEGLEGSLNDWNLRKCSAAALDAFSNRFAPEVLKIIQPHLLERINAQEWQVRESAVLAFGAIAQGCLAWNNIAFVSELVPFLAKLLQDPHAQIREISCWALGRYGEPITRSDLLFPLVFEALMVCSLDTNKKVQEAGLGALSVLAELGGDKLSPFVEQLLGHFQQCFAKYQQKNMMALYECIQSTVAAVSYSMNDPKHVQLLMDPIFRRWQTYDDSDRELLPLLECLSAVAANAGPSFAPFAQTVFERCVELIKQTLILDERYKMDPSNCEEPEKEFIICALDLIDGLTQGLEANVGPLLQSCQDPPLMDMVQVCFDDDMPEVRQSAFALVGDMAIYTFDELQPRVNAVLQSLIMNIVSMDPRSDPVCNNAMWATGEITLKIGAAIEPYFNELFRRLGTVLFADNMPSLLENAAIVMGRLGLSMSVQIAPHLREFIDKWLSVMTNVDETNEKDTAFQGICLSIGANPSALNESQLYSLLVAFASYYDPSPELRQLVSKLLAGYRTFLNNFDEIVSRLGPAMAQQLQVAYAA